jgi:recombination protein RecA
MNKEIKAKDGVASVQTSGFNDVTKRKLLDDTLARINKQYGTGAIMVMGEEQNLDIESFSTGSILLDQAIGCHGVPKGRVIEVFGPESSGKTTIALQIIAEAQKSGGVAAFIDAEHALDLHYAKKLGIKTSELILSQPDYGEQALDIVDSLVRSAAVDVIVVDSVAALVPKAELEGDMGDAHVGILARLMSQALRKLTPLVNRSKVVLIFINQIRQNINSLPFAPKETTPGGNALKFFASVRLDVRRVESLKDKDGVQYGNKVAVRIVKNKLARPFTTVHAYLIFGYGISKYYELLHMGLDTGIIEMNGSWIYYKNEKVCQGKDMFIDIIKKDLNLFNKIYTNLHEHINKVVE